MQYRGEERTTELPLTQDMIGQLAFEAAFRNVTIGELIGQLIIAVADKDLLQTVLEHKKPWSRKEGGERIGSLHAAIERGFGGPEG
jgi:hypothetical protein